MPIAVDLEINRCYLDTKFEGYKLNSAPLPTTIKNIPEGIDIVHPGDDQYSFMQQREYSIHNHVHSDPWDSLSIYYVDSEWKIKRLIALAKEDVAVEGPYEVWEVPKRKQRVAGQSNVTVCFATEDIVAVSDGAGTVYILSTGDREQKSTTWKVLCIEELERPGRIIDVRSPAQGIVHLLFVFVDSKQTYLNHLVFTSSEGDDWKTDRCLTISGKGTLDYGALDSNCSFMYIISQEELKSQDSIEEEDKPKPSSEDTFSFEWQQNYEEVKVWLDMDDSSRPTIKVSPSELTVTLSGRVLVSGQLYRPIEEGLTVWNVKNNRLEVVMSKRDEGSMWSKIFEISEFKGKEVHDPDLVAEIHSKLAHLTSETEDVGGATVLNSGQLEECDISDGERRGFFVYNLSSPVISIVHKVELGSGQWLMHGPRLTKRPPYFCIRSDVDGIVYTVTGEHKVVHDSTFCAFGFVQASKSSRIYSFFPSDLSYTGIVDADGRLFLYKGGLRPGEKISWGKQHLLNLPNDTRVIGFSATPHHIFLLCSHKLHVIGLPPS